MPLQYAFPTKFTLIMKFLLYFLFTVATLTNLALGQPFFAPDQEAPNR